MRTRVFSLRENVINPSKNLGDHANFCIIFLRELLRVLCKLFLSGTVHRSCTLFYTSSETERAFSPRHPGCGIK